MEKNRFNRAAKYLALILIVELASFVVVLLQYMGLLVDTDGWWLLGISMASNLSYMVAMYKFYKLFGGDFKKAYYCTAMVLVVAVVLILLPFSLSLDVLAIIALATAIAGLLSYYYILTSFAAICNEMKTPRLERTFIVGRSMYMIVTILSVPKSLFGDTLAYAVNVISSGISIYILLLYNRLRKELTAYKEPDERPGIEE